MELESSISNAMSGSATPSDAAPGGAMPTGRSSWRLPMPDRLDLRRAALQMPATPEGADAIPALPATATRLVLGSCLFSIRVPPKSAIVNCELCSKPFSAKGPTGYYDERPICDACLLEQENQLGMLMALSIFTRSYANLAMTEGEAAAGAATEMLAFARIYELFAARFGPSRPFDFSSVSALRAIG